MPIQEETAGARPWIVFIGLSKVPQPKRMADLHPLWASGSVVGSKHILTAAHVCKNLDLARRILKLTSGYAGLVCIPGFHGTFTTATKVYNIADDAYKVSTSCLHSTIEFTTIEKYGKTLRKAERQNFYSNDLGMYFLSSKLPKTVPQATIHAETDAYLDPAKKNSLLAHGYPLKSKGRLMYAKTHCAKAFPDKIAMHDAILREGASGGPLWRTSSPKPTVIGTVSGYDIVNVGGPTRGFGRDSETGEYGKIVYFDDTKKFILLKRLDPKPPAAKHIEAGIASRITATTLAEIQGWMKE